MTDYEAYLFNKNKDAMTAFETYLFAKNKASLYWRVFIEREPDLEKKHCWLEKRLIDLTYDQIEYFKDHKSYRDTYYHFLGLTTADLYREVEPVNAGDLLLHHVMLSVMLMRYWELKANIH